MELGPLSMREWIGLTARDRAPFGDSSAGLVFRPKTKHVGLRNASGELVAVAGVTLVTVEVAPHPPFDVVGLGGLILRPELRGLGVAGPIMDRIKTITEESGPDRAMLFCEPELQPLYARRGYRVIGDPVTVDQPEGEIEMPLSAMWRPLRSAVEWPPGPIRIHGLPF